MKMMKLWMIVSVALILLMACVAAGYVPDSCHKILVHLEPVLTLLHPAVSQPHELIVGQGLLISCNVSKKKTTSSPHPIYMWWCNATDEPCFNINKLQSPYHCDRCFNVSKSDKYAISSSTSLHIENGTKSDSYMYSCWAYSDDTQINCNPGNSSINITFQEKFGPNLIVHPRNITTTVGRTVELVCVDEGYPTPAVGWFKDGALIHDGRLVTLRNVSTNHTGLYRCCSTNRFDRKCYTVSLKVEETEKNAVYVVVAAVSGGVILGLMLSLGCFSLKYKRDEATVSRHSESIQSEEDERLIETSSSE